MKNLNNKPVKVLQFAPGFLFGGIESRMLDWYHNIDREKIQFDLLKQSNNPNSTTNIENLQKLGADVFNLPQFKYYNIVSYCRAINSFFKTNIDYDIIHSHSVTLGVFVLYYAKKYGVKKRVLHSRTTKFDGGRIRKILSRIMNYFARSYATDYFACSQKAGEFAFGKKSNFSIINNGIELCKYHFDKDIRDKIRLELELSSSFVIGSVCRFTKPKNLPFMIDIFIELIKKEPNAKLLLVGDGPLKDYVNSRFIEVDLLDKLILVGKKDNVWDFYFAMDVFLSPSLWEGFGTSVIEAQAAGLPCIVSDQFPPSTQISEYTLRLSLSNPISFWVGEVLKMKNYRENQNIINKIADAGFDIVKVSQKLQEFYQS